MAGLCNSRQAVPVRTPRLQDGLCAAGQGAMLPGRRWQPQLVGLGAIHGAHPTAGTSRKHQDTQQSRAWRASKSVCRICAQSKLVNWPASTPRLLRAPGTSHGLQPHHSFANSDAYVVPRGSSCVPGAQASAVAPLRVLRAPWQAAHTMPPPTRVCC